MKQVALLIVLSLIPFTVFGIDSSFSLQKIFSNKKSKCSSLMVRESKIYDLENRINLLNSEVNEIESTHAEQIYKIDVLNALLDRRENIFESYKILTNEKLKTDSLTQRNKAEAYLKVLYLKRKILYQILKSDKKTENTNAEIQQIDAQIQQINTQIDQAKTVLNLSQFFSEQK